MATNRIPLKRRRRSPQAEAEAWSTTFETSFDFFGELVPFGIVHPVDVWPPEARDWDGFKALAADAWRRLGARHMANRDRHWERQGRPWAEEQFGAPHAD